MGVVWTFFLSSIISLFLLILWEMARYRLRYCLKGPLSPNQPTNQRTPRHWKLTQHHRSTLPPPCLQETFLKPEDNLWFKGYKLYNYVYTDGQKPSGGSSILVHDSCPQGDGAMVLGKLPVPGRPTIWITVGQGPTALTVCAGGGCLDIFTLLYPFSPLSPSLLGTARYRLKYCLKGPLNPKQPTILSTTRFGTSNGSASCCRFYFFR